MKRVKVVLFTAITLFVLGSPAIAEKDEIRFFCGAAVKVPMDEIIQSYEKDKGIRE
jgi:ABC-type molybdate transport system substrate-binding protein